jgi:hypothetical protein
MYELEPSLHDVYVEGYFDRDVIAACFDHAKLSNRIVYPVDSVDVPFALLEKYGLTDGNKQRVIALAQELVNIPGNKCKFLVDRDIDHWFEPVGGVPNLVWTRYCSLELYFFSDIILRRILIVTAKTRVGEWDQFVRGFCDALIYMYAARLADRELDLKLTWLDADKDLDLDKGLVTFDYVSYVNRVLNKNARVKNRDEFMTSLDSWYQKCTEQDCKLAIRGHDFVHLLAFVVKSGKGATTFGNIEAIERLFVLLATSDMELYADLLVA